MNNYVDIMLLKFAESFVNERLDAEIFANAYIELWKIAGNNNFFSNKDFSLGECIGSLFIACDRYNPSPDRHEYDYGESGLKDEVVRLLNEYKQEI